MFTAERRGEYYPSFASQSTHSTAVEVNICHYGTDTPSWSAKD